MKKFITAITIFGLTIFGVFLVFAHSVGIVQAAVQTVWAEDDEEDDEDEEDEEENEMEDDDSASSEKVTEYETVYVKQPDTIVETTKQVPLHDSDMDGMYDDDDPHPYINEYIIVRDDDLNGIDDRYEG